MTFQIGKSLSKGITKYGDTLFVDATKISDANFLNDFPSDVRKLFLQEEESQQNPVQICSLKLVEQLVPSFPQLDIVHLGIVSKQDDITNLLWNTLAENKSITKIDRLWIPSNPSKEVLKSLEAIFENNNHLKRVSLSFDLDPLVDYSDDRALEAISRGLAQNKTLERLELCDLKLHNLDVLTPLLSSAPISVKLQHFTFLGPPSEQAFPEIENAPTRSDFSVSNSKIEHIEFSVHPHTMNMDYVEYLMEVLAKANLPHLKHLNIDLDPSREEHLPLVDLTLSMAHIIDQSKLLKSVEIRGLVTVSSSLMCSYLQQNKSLERYSVTSTLINNHDRIAFSELLENHNSTLEEVSLLGGTMREHQGPCQKALQSIQYYCTLNKFGRSIARRQATTKEEFISCLIQAAAAPGETCSSMEGPALSNLRNIQHGLLRECPSLWST